MQSLNVICHMSENYSRDVTYNSEAHLITHLVSSSNIADCGNYSGQLFQRPLRGTWVEINGILGKM